MMRIKRCFVATTTIFLFLIFLSMYSSRYTLQSKSSVLRSLKLLADRDEWDIDQPNEHGQFCQIPQPDPWDKSILKFISERVLLHCRRVQPELTFIDTDSVLRINVTALEDAGYSATSLTCTYQTFNRILGKDDETEYDAEKDLDLNGSPITSVDFVTVRCKNWIGWPVYANLHAHPRPVVKESLQKYSTRAPLNVLAFGVDSMSRLNFMRQLPATYKYLVKDMGSIVLHGLTKVGDNTYPNVVSMLTGQLTQVGPWSRPPMGVYFDTWPLIWKNFSEAGFYTLLAEDHPDFTIFNYMSSGFYNQPTDFYLRPFYVAMEKFSTYKLSSYLCFGSTAKHVLHNRYVEEFLVNYVKKPYFAFSFLTEASHNLLNQISLADDDLENFLRRIHEGGFLEDTIMFFFGDHGHRFDPIRMTPIGRIEGSMPFCAIYLPPKIRESQPEIVKVLLSNSRRLTSMVDFYETFADILRYNTLGTKLGSDFPSLSPWGLNFFRQIPLNRTCAMAGVMQQFCMCSTKEEMLNSEDERFLQSAQILIDTINDETLVYRNICSPLKVYKVHSAFLVVERTDVEKKEEKVRVTVEVTPGNGVFEGTVHLKKKNEAMRDISRINEYGGQDQCVTSQMMTETKIDLRKYCHCG